MLIKIYKHVYIRDLKEKTYTIYIPNMIQKITPFFKLKLLVGTFGHST